MVEQPPGEYALLEDGHVEEVAPHGKPVVGWRPTSQGVRGWFNPNGWAALSSVVRRIVGGVMRSF